MAIELPSSAIEVEERSKTDVQRDLPGSNPFLENSAIGAVVTSNANRVFDFYGQLNLLQFLLLPDNAKGEFLERWAAIYGRQRLAATIATGNIVSSGTPGSPIPVNTLFAASNNEIYESTSSAIIIAQSTPSSTLTRSGSVATMVTTIAHNLAVNVPVTVVGAAEPEYNVIGAAILSIANGTTFTYAIAGTPSTPATGTISVEYNSAVVPIDSQNFQDSENNVDVNLESGTLVTLQSPLVGVDNNLGVGAVPIGGGDESRNRPTTFI